MEEFRLLEFEQAQGPVPFYVADLILHKNAQLWSYASSSYWQGG